MDELNNWILMILNENFVYLWVLLFSYFYRIDCGEHFNNRLDAIIHSSLNYGLCPSRENNGYLVALISTRVQRHQGLQGFRSMHEVIRD